MTVRSATVASEQPGQAFDATVEPWTRVALQAHNRRTMIPTIGRVVLVQGITANGAKVHPAIITRVWSDTCVNLTVLPDNEQPQLHTSVQLQDSEPSTMLEGQVIAYWPPRV